MTACRGWSGIHKTTRKTLQAVHDLELPSIRDIAEEIEKSHQTAKKHLDKLEKNGLINVQETDHVDIRTVSGDGEDAMLNNPLDLEGVDSSEEDVDPFFVHFFAINCEFNDKNFLPEDWRERFKEFEAMTVEEHRDFDRVQVKTDRWVYRLTGRSLEVRLSHEVSGSDVRQVKDRAWSEALEGLEEFEEMMRKELDRPEFEFPRDRMMIRIQSQHIGARRRHLVKAFIDHIDLNTVYNARDFEVVGDDEEIRIYCDASGPDGMLEGEAGNGGQVNGRMDTAEDDMALLQDFTNRLIENPDSARRLTSAPERLDEVEDKVEQIEETMVEFSRSVASSMEEVTSTVENNVGQGSQVQKQVMEMKQVQDELQEELTEVRSGIEKLVQVTEQSVSVQSSRSVSDEKIVDRLEEISEKMDSGSSRDSIVSPVADHVEIDSKWEDRWGNIRGYSSELGKQFKLIDSEDL